MSEKRARKRAARGEDSEVTMLRRARTVGSVGTGVAKIDILAVFVRERVYVPVVSVRCLDLLRCGGVAGTESPESKI